jgi:microcystin-dependent protein
MTLQFPSDPINGAVSGDYTYDATKGAWRKNAALPVSVTHSDVAPSNPREGDQWWKSDEGTLFTYYNDGSSSQWVESTNVIANVEPNPIPAGAMMAWGSDTIPSNWLLCDGSAINRSTYASLFAAIGTQYGNGDGTTTFNLPNIKGRTIVGKDVSQTEFDVLGETGGAKTHTLTVAQMPAHTHTQYPIDWYVVPTNTNTSRGGTVLPQSNTVPTGSTGGGGAHNNLQPYIVLNYIIKYSAGETPGDSQLATRVGTLETQNNATPISPNYVINGAFDIWQRGDSISGLGYGADMWYAPFSSCTVSRSTDAPEGFKYSFSVSRSAGTVNYVLQRIESDNSSMLVGKTVTASFWAKNTGSDESLEVSLYSANSVNDFSGTTIIGSATVLAPSGFSASWTKYSATFNNLPASVANGMHIQIVGRTEASSSGHSFLLAGVQLEEGFYATPFRRSAPSIQAELAACQRYYRRISGASVTVASGTYYTSTRAYFASTMPEMRVVPLITASAASAVLVFSNGNSAASTSLVFAEAVRSTSTWEFDAITSTRTAGHGAWARINGASNFIEFNAEL